VAVEGEDSQAAPSRMDGRADQGRHSAVANSCLIGLLIAMLLALVVIPVLLWTLGIACGGG
jgi:hypothetical protein